MRRNYDLTAIDAALAEGLPLREVARQFDIPVSTLHRHVKRQNPSKTPIPGRSAPETEQQVEHLVLGGAADPAVLIEKSRTAVAAQLDELATMPAEKTSLLTRSTILKNLAATAKTLAEATAAGGKKATARERAREATRAGKYAVPATPPGLLLIDGGKN
jgi:transposase-like protein